MKFNQLVDRGVKQDFWPAGKNVFAAEMMRAAPGILGIEFASYVGDTAKIRKPASAAPTSNLTRAKLNGWGDNNVQPETLDSTLTIFGPGKFGIDEADISRWGADAIPDLVTEELVNFAYDAGRAFWNQLINGSSTSDPLTFNGILTSFNALPSAQKNTLAATTLSGSGYINTNDYVLELIGAIREGIQNLDNPATGIILPNGIMGRLDAVGGQLTNAGLDPFNQTVKGIDGVPLIRAGKSHTKAAVLPWDSSNDGTIIIYHSREKKGVAGFGNGIRFKKKGEGEAVTITAEWDVDLQIVNPDDIFVITGVKYGSA